MKIIIIEDEQVAANALINLIHEVEPQAEILEVLTAVEDAIDYFHRNDMPDVILTDINLGDGSAFTIFENVKVTCPIIFTTAYDDYALKAFEQNSVDYLLKPITEEKLKRAFNKIIQRPEKVNNEVLINQLLTTLRQQEKKYKQTLLLPIADHFVPLSVYQITYIMAEDHGAKIVTRKNVYSVAQSLDKLFEELNPEDFFRVSRQVIVAHDAIKDMVVWFNGALALEIEGNEEKITIPRRTVKEFKDWYTAK